MRINQLVKEMEKSYELTTPIEQVEGGRYLIPIEEEVAVLLSETSDQFLLEAVIGNIPKEGKEEFFRDLLMGNLFGQATRGGVLSIDDKGEAVHLAETIPQSLPFPRFLERFEDFIEVIDFWRNELLTKK